MWVMNMTTPGEDVYQFLARLPVGTSLYLQDFNNHTLYAAYRSTAAPAAQTGYWQIPVAYLGAGSPLVGQKILLALFAPDEQTPPPPYVSHAYATTDQLAALLNLTAPTTAQTEGMQRVLDAAAAEIDWEIPYNTDSPAPSPPPPLVVQVNLARAVELWKEAWTGFGIVPLGPDVVPVVTARDSWHRHARTLAPLKTEWGVA